MLEGRYFLGTNCHNFLSKLTIDYYYYYLFLLKTFSFSLLIFNNLTCKKLIKINKIIQLYSKSSLVKKNNILNNYLDVKIKYKIEYKKNIFNSNLNLKSNTQVDMQSNSLNKITHFPLTYFKLFNLFFLFNFSIFNSNFKLNFKLNFFLVKEFKKKVILININKFFSRWIDAHSIFYNIFYYDFLPLAFGSSLMKNEVLALNWYYSKFDINLWNYYFPFFIFKLTNYNKKSEYFFAKLFDAGINFFIIIDAAYHYKNLHYFNRYNYYTVGLIDMSLDPALIAYPIINFFNNYSIQIFFFRLILFIQKSVFLKKFVYLKNIWIQVYLNNFFSSI